MDMAAGNSMQRRQHFDGLHRQGHRMFLAFFHPLYRNAPDRRVEVEFIPLRFNGFTRAAKGQPHETKCGNGFMATAMSFHIAQRPANLGGIERVLVLDLVGRQCLAHRIDRIELYPQD